jgi:sugar/nucleoside kinase (ribokinase family)
MAVCGGDLQLMDTGTKTLDVIAGGDLFVDLMMSGFPSWPQPGTEAFSKELHRDVGGGAAISACGLARLGTRAAVLGVVGHDSGEWIADRLTQVGVVTSRLRFDPVEPSGLTVAISTPEDRTFLTYHGSNRHFPAMLAEAASSGQLANVRHIHLAWAPDLDTAAELLVAIRRQGCSISLDVGWHEDWLTDPRAIALLPMIDIFFPNEVEARRMTGEDDRKKILHKLASADARLVALKLGPAGAALLLDGDILSVKSYPVKPIDTTGAGDCFNAGFLHFWLRGESPLTCLRAGNFCGAASTAAFGGVNGFPDLESVRLELTNPYA